ncbi:four helix bundle protein [Candidatus Azambacteria bacterium]|nr:four helix bundle protein [Candidatus Azambacteria bacterium]
MSVVKITHELPSEYRYTIGDQMIRSGLSIVLNIAEGSGKESDKELNRYFNIAMGSTNETLAVIDVLSDLRIADEKKMEEAEKLCVSISKQLGGFKKKLKK